MIELRHLRYFVVVAEELHFGRAAKRLHMAQSPLSQQILALERHLDVELIDRPHSVVGLTDAGHAFLGAARDILADVEAAVSLARRAARGEAGTLRVGYVGEVTADLLPLALKAFRAEYDDVELELTEGTTGHLLDALRQKTLDVAFVRSPWAVGDLLYEGLIEESLMLASPVDTVPDDGSPRLEDMGGSYFVVPTHRAARGLRLDIDAAFSAAGVTPKVVREASSLTAVLLLVAGGAGCALVPASVAHLFPVPGVGYAHLADPAPITTAGMAWRAADRSRILAHFLDTARQTARERLGQPDVWPERHIIDASPDGAGPLDVHAS